MRTRASPAPVRLEMSPHPTTVPWIGADGTGVAYTGIAAGAAAGTATVNICPGPTPGGTAT